MADAGTINKIKIGNNEFELDASLLNGQDSTYYQVTSNLTQTIDANSTDTEYPSAECVYDLLGSIEDILEKI